jgi:hypothetical protein
MTALVCIVMRTTLTLDEDVAIEVERLRRARRQSLKQVINDLLRIGIADTGRPATVRRSRFKTAVADTGRALLPDVDNVAEVLELLGDDRVP